MALKSSFGWMGAFSIGAAIFLSGCAGTAHVEKAKSANLTSYKTYSWIDKDKTRSKDEKKNHSHDIVDQNIRSSVNEQLQKKGYVESTTAPDLLISSDLVVEKNQKEQRDPVYSDSYTRNYYNPRTGRINTYYFPSQFMGYDSYPTSVKEGTVTVTLIDAKTDKAVWQGWATKELLNRNISSKEIDQNVKSIFKKFDAD
jgi:hypothetical protein